MSEFLKLDRESAIELIRKEPEKFYDLICNLIARVENLERENTELKRRLNINSKNSSQPPSKDRFKTKKNLREKSNRKHAAQPGHVGKSLLMVNNPDRISIIEKTICDKCSTDLKEGTNYKKYKRQVFDLPVLPRMEVTEYVSYSKICPGCSHKNPQLFPSNVTNNTQYGKNIELLIIYFHDYQLLPFERVTEIFNDLFGFEISVGAI